MGSYQRTAKRAHWTPRTRKRLCQTLDKRGRVVRRAPWVHEPMQENHEGFDVPTRRERGVDRKSGDWRI